ncbi:hypothetical protein BFF78_41340 [Streptomyces fodineus]|uniref:Short-chain dehydrogenase n=1 Tax=Streptomyces fodineus TaxID=1904616 RepID=A0A1D7YM69_9ACTN|nr:hypothetical protein BFF78_41340 [Streptomyces fodineus]
MGAAVARRLAGDGIRVVVNSARSASAGKELAAELPDAVYVQGDVADTADAGRIVAETIETYGRLDILVNNAGTTRFIPLEDLQAADAAVWREIFGVNVFGVWQLTTAAVPYLQQSPSAAIVNISSVSAPLTRRCTVSVRPRTWPRPCTTSPAPRTPPVTCSPWMGGRHIV